MCGIVGTFGGNIEHIEEACIEMSHRGPDDFGTYIDRNLNIALGHQRLSILDLTDLGHQPMISNDKNIVIIFNGEIYNYLELKVDLESKGFTFKGNSDTEVLLNLYHSEGKQMLSRLNGIFAFAILDIREELLFLARDAFGVKPLYYSAENKIFSFASEIKSLLKFDYLNKDLSIESLNRYIAFLWCPGDGTPIKSVKKLLPGQALVVKKGQVTKKWIWYQLPFFRGVKSNLNAKQAISGVTDHLRKAVHGQMISDVPLGAFLSGGLDSSSIVSFARELNPNIKCFTIGTLGKQDKGFIDDLPYAKKVAEHLELDLQVVTVSSNQIADDIQLMVRQLDEPLADPASLNVKYISSLARSQGIKVLLSGAGGDDLFTGYRRHYAAHLERYWSWFPQNLREFIEDNSKKYNLNNSFNRRLQKFFNGAALKKEERLINYFRWTSDETLQSLFSNEFREIIFQEDANLPMSNFISPISNKINCQDQMLALEQRFFLSDHNLNYTDKMSMAEGLEVRVPFLDKELVEFAAKIPIKYKQKGIQGKWVLKKAMEPFLPKNIIYRPKAGFGIPLRRWLKDDLRELIGDYLSIDSINKRGLFSYKAIEKLISDNENGKIDAAYTILSLLCIEIWCREYIDK